MGLVLAFEQHDTLNTDVSQSLAPFSSISPVLHTSSSPSWRLCAPFTVSSAEKTYSSHNAFLPFPLYDGIYIISGRVMQAQSALSSKSSVTPVLHVFVNDVCCAVVPRSISLADHHSHIETY